MISMLRFLDSDKTRACMACVCKTWQAFVRKSWDKVHFCFKSKETLSAQLKWFTCQLQDNPLLLRSLALHCSRPTTPILSGVLSLFCSATHTPDSCLMHTFGHAESMTLAPASLDMGLERFGALCHLDLQSVCGTPVYFEVPSFRPWQDPYRSRCTFPRSAVRHLAALSGSLQTLRLQYDEGVRGQVTPIYVACLTALQDDFFNPNPEMTPLMPCRPGHWTTSALSPASQNSGSASLGIGLPLIAFRTWS